MRSDEDRGMDQAGSLTGQLSRREYEVLHHIQLGLTNGQIAERLFVSRNTVNKHVHHVLRKLDVTNRVQAAVLLRGGPEAIGPDPGGWLPSR
jgi:DNA-binding NarL/FixJ family response regulator